jgi:type I restriction enzyme, S subunit
VGVDGERELPAGWAWVNLGQVCNVTGGIQKQAKRRPVRNKFPFLRVANVGRGSLDLNEIHEIELFEGELERFRLRNGDLLVVEGNGSPDQIGRAAMWHGVIKDAVHQNHLIKVRPTSAIDPKFLELLWNSPLVSVQLARVAQSTSGLYTLSTSKLNRVEFALPPLAEQQRIVEAVEEYLSRLASAGTDMGRSQKRIHSLKRQLIEQAVSVPDGAAVEVQLGDVSELVKNGIFVSRPGVVPSGVPILRISAVRPLSLDVSDVRYTALEQDEEPVSGALLSAGDLLFTRYNGNAEFVGAAAVVPEGVGPLTYPDKLIRVVVDRGKVDPDYLALLCASVRARKFIRSHVKTSAGQVGISGRELKKVPLLLPGVPEQRERVRRFKERMDGLARLNTLVCESTRRSDSLRRAILGKAFRGELVAQDLADEPASVLLGRVAVDLAVKPKARRPRKPAANVSAKPPAQRAAASADPAPEPTPAPTFAVQQEFDL